MRRTITALLAACIAFVLAAPAEAGTYAVHTCKLPNGAPAATDGWQATGSVPYGYFANGCATGGGLTATLGGASHVSGQSHIGWSWRSGGAPIVAYTIHRSATVNGGGFGTSALFYTARGENDPSGGRGVDYCAHFQGCRRVGDPAAGATPANRLAEVAPAIPTQTTAWFATIGCGGYAGYSCTPEGTAPLAAMQIHAASFTLADDVAPTARDHSGSLTESDALRFTASDDLSGVFRVLLEVDGSVVSSFTPNDLSGRCVRRGFTGATNDFTDRTPCPRSQPIELAAPSGLAAGSHTLRVRIEDAASNAATAYGPVKVTVAGEPSPHVIARNALAQLAPRLRIRLRALRSRVRPYGRMLLIGRVRTARLERGVPVEVQLRGKRRWRTVAIRRTNTTGSFRFRYRFKRTARAKLAFRARVRAHPDLPATPLPSRSVRIRVG